jgi:chromosome segregation ATPase
MKMLKLKISGTSQWILLLVFVLAVFAAVKLRMDVRTLEANLKSSTNITKSLKNRIDGVTGGAVKQSQPGAADQDKGMLMAQLAEYQQKLDEMTKLANDNMALTKELKKERASLRQERFQLRQKIDEMTKSVQAATPVNADNFDAEITQVNQEINSIQTNLSSNGEDITDVETEIKRQDSEIKRLEKLLAQGKGGMATQTREEIKAAAREVDDRKDEITQLKKELLLLQNKEQQYKERLEDIAKRTEERLKGEFGKEKQKLERDLSETKKNATLTTKERDQYLAQLTELKQSQKDSLSKFSKVTRENEHLANEVIDMHYNLGVVLTKQKNYTGAVKEYEKVLTLSPNDEDAHYNLAILYDEIFKDSKKALEHYRSYLRIKPDASDAVNVQKWIVDKEAEVKVAD